MKEVGKVVEVICLEEGTFIEVDFLVDWGELVDGCFIFFGFRD